MDFLFLALSSSKNSSKFLNNPMCGLASAYCLKDSLL